MTDWLEVLEAGIREQRPDWSYLIEPRTFGFGVPGLGTFAFEEKHPCLILGPWDAKVVVDGAELRVFFGCHRYQDRLGMDDPHLFEKIIQRAERED